MSNYTHRIKFHYGTTWRSWDCGSEKAARDVLARIMSAGIELKTAGGNVTIIPPWQIRRVEIKPIRRRSREIVRAADPIARADATLER